MDNTILNDIKKYAVQRLNQAYGYCGVAESPEVVMLNSGGDDENITITIKCPKMTEATHG